MTGFAMLWLPILLSSVFIFIVSSLIHMFSPWHKGDYSKLANEEKVMDSLRSLNIPPGDYMMPMPADRKDMSSPEFLEKRKKGPVAVFTIYPPGAIRMGKSMVLWFVYLLLVSIFAAYIAGRALPAGAAYLSVFRFSGATAFFGYCVALWQQSIWYNRSWTTTFKITVDGLVYGLITAATFGWLWPQA